MKVNNLRIYGGKLLTGYRRLVIIRILILWIMLSGILLSCETEREHESPWFTYSISGYIEANQDEYSKFYRIIKDGRVDNTLSAYNPYTEGYTLFLPTDEAIDHYIEQNPYISNIGELLLDTGFLYNFSRYHALNEKVHSSNFPFGALTQRTLTGDRLTISFHPGDENQIIKVNDVATIIKPNLEMTNGYIHVISEVLQPVEISGYDWIQQNDKYSILAEAMKLAGIRERLNTDEYTIFAEQDSIYHKYGINTIVDLIDRVASPWTPYSNEGNAFYQFVAYHIAYGEYYLNDLEYGLSSYSTLSYRSLAIDSRLEIEINPGVDNYGISISESGDTTMIDYIGVDWDACNILTGTGPIHSVNELLVSEALTE